jgi:hypothetical protein
VHREWMREHAQGDPFKAADIRLREMNARPGNTVKAVSLVVYAADSIRDEGRANRGDVPTMDAPAGDVTSKKDRKKGRRGAASSNGPKKSKRGTGFVKRIGQTVAGFKAGFAPDDERLLDMLRKGGFDREPNTIRKEPVWGFCPINEATGSTAEITSLPTIGSDPDFVVFGLRRDAKTGCPTFRFRADAERQATTEALAESKQNATSARIREIADDLCNAWYIAATPTTQLFPVVWQRSTWTLWVHSDNADALAQAASLAGATLGSLARLPNHLDGLPDDLHRTDLRSSDGAAKGTADPSADLLLWLIGKSMGGTGVVNTDEGKLEWWLEDAVELERNTADEKKLRVKLGGAPAEGGSLATALADGATIRNARVTLKMGEDKWRVTLGPKGSVKGWTLPVLTKPDGTDRGLDTAIDERIRLWRRGDGYLAQLVTVFRSERLDRGNWRQRTSAIQREVIKGIDHARERFIAASGQVAMFAEQVAEHVQGQNAEASPKRGGSRNGRKREETGDEAGGAP